MSRTGVRARTWRDTGSPPARDHGPVQSTLDCVACPPTAMITNDFRQLAFDLWMLLTHLSIGFGFGQRSGSTTSSLSAPAQYFRDWVTGRYSAVNSFITAWSAHPVPDVLGTLRQQGTCDTNAAGEKELPAGIFAVARARGRLFFPVQYPQRGVLTQIPC